jgi:hypothetical protein
MKLATGGELKFFCTHRRFVLYYNSIQLNGGQVFFTSFTAALYFKSVV